MSGVAPWLAPLTSTIDVATAAVKIKLMLSGAYPTLAPSHMYCSATPSLVHLALSLALRPHPIAYLLPAANEEEAMEQDEGGPDGRTVIRTTAASKTAWWCCFGWLVDDIVGTAGGSAGDKAAVAHCNWVSATLVA